MGFKVSLETMSKTKNKVVIFIYSPKSLNCINLKSGLKEMKEYDELSELLISLNRPEEAAYLEYERKLEQNKSAKARSMALEATLKVF